jgi:hypothetical protein
MDSVSCGAQVATGTGYSQSILIFCQYTPTVLLSGINLPLILLYLSTGQHIE